MISLLIRSFLAISVVGTLIFASQEMLLAQGEPPYDLLIRNGRIVDGCGTPWFEADVALRSGRIARINRRLEVRARRTIDARGLIVAPGFIDMLGQTATPFLRDPRAGNNLLSQGITTIRAGEGVSAAPLSAAQAKTNGWGTMREYFAALEKRGLPVNVAQSIGHAQVRRLVIGDTDRPPTLEELTEMRDWVREAMEAGAIGLSSALTYPPAVYASTDELVALAEVAGHYGGRYYTHLRNEGDRLIEAIDEALTIGAGAGIPVHIFHLKAAGYANWAKMDLALSRLRTARAGGQEVDADIYPYVYAGLDLEAFIHPRHFAQGDEEFHRKLSSPRDRAEMRRDMEEEEGWENWFRHCGYNWDKVILNQIRASPYRQHNGKSLPEIGRAVRKDSWEVFWEILQSGAFALPHTMSEANIIKALREDFVSLCTDVGPAAGSAIAGHPRAYGSFPRVLAHYARDLGVISLEKAVAKLSSLAANQILALDRGRLAEGLAADIVIFDLHAIRDRATFANPNTEAEGVVFVIVNGQVVLDQGKFTGALPGKLLRGPGYRSKE